MCPTMKAENVLERLHNLAARTSQQVAQLTALHLRPAQGPAITAPLGSEWQSLPGLPGIRVFHVPDPDGAPGLFISVVQMAPGTRVDGIRQDEPTRVCCVDGSYRYNGRLIQAGDSHWMAPNEEQHIETSEGCTNMALFNALPFDIPIHPTQPIPTGKPVPTTCAAPPRPYF